MLGKTRLSPHTRGRHRTPSVPLTSQRQTRRGSHPSPSPPASSLDAPQRPSVPLGSHGRRCKGAAESARCALGACAGRAQRRGRAIRAPKPGGLREARARPASSEAARAQPSLPGRAPPASRPPEPLRRRGSRPEVVAPTPRPRVGGSGVLSLTALGSPEKRAMSSGPGTTLLPPRCLPLRAAEPTAGTARASRRKAGGQPAPPGPGVPRRHVTSRGSSQAPRPLPPQAARSGGASFRNWLPEGVQRAWRAPAAFLGFPRK